MVCQSTPTATLEGTSLISSNIVSTSVYTELRVVSDSPVVISTCVPTTVGNSSTCAPNVVTSPGGPDCKRCIYPHYTHPSTVRVRSECVQSQPPVDGMDGRLLSSSASERCLPSQPSAVAVLPQGYQPLVPNARTSPLSESGLIHPKALHFIHLSTPISFRPSHRIAD